MRSWVSGFIILMVMGSPVHAEKDWQVLKTDNFRIYAHDVEADFIKTVMKESEEALSDVLENLGLRKHNVWTQKSPVSIYIYKNEEDYVKNGGQAGWSHGAALIQSRAIRTFPAASGFFDSILPHELGHIVLHEYIGIYIPIPLWFDEGVAMYQEKAKQLGGLKATRVALKNGKFIPLTQLANVRLYAETDLETVRLFYAESASIVNFMITELGDFRFRKLCRELKNNRSFDNALTSAYPRVKDLNDLNKQWVQFLQDYE